MSSHSPLRLVLEVDPLAEPITGHVEGSGGTVDFVGWLGLASALERLLSDTLDGDERRGAD